jgi:hypothetical protein
MSPPRPAPALLNGLSGPAAGQTFVLREDTVSLGRGEECNIVLRDPSISRLQAKFRWAGGQWAIFNCTPDTKVFVEGEAASHRVLTYGARFRVGASEFEFQESSDSVADERGTASRALVPAASPPAEDFFDSTETRVDPGGPGGLSDAAPPSAAKRRAPRPDGIPSGLAPESPREPSPPDPEARRLPGGAAYSLLVVVLLLGGTLAIVLVGHERPSPPVRHIVIPEGGNGQLVAVYPIFYAWIGRKEEKSSWQETVDARKQSPPCMVDLRGKKPGIAEVPLFDLRGRHILTLEVTVRGRTHEEPVYHAGMSVSEAISRAKELLENGRQLERDFCHKAIVTCYRPTVGFLSRINSDEAQRLAAEAGRRLRNAEDTLRSRIESHEQQFWQTYYLGEYARSLQQLRHILEWVPDASDKRHQRAAILAAIVRQKAAALNSSP